MTMQSEKSAREHFTKFGIPKKKLTRLKAELLADDLGEGVNAYECTWPDCDCWHVGRSTNGDWYDD
jgi:hypothetical protein